MRTSSLNSSTILVMSTGVISIVTGLLPIAGTLLLTTFGYPEIIRESPQVILGRLHEARDSVPFLYYLGIGGAGIGFFFLTLLLSKILKNAGDDTWSRLGKYCGMANGLCLYAGIIR